MSALGPVRGVMFDSGGVLTRPVGGRWNPRYDFESIVLAHAPQVRADRFPRAFAVGDQALLATEETLARSEYHRVMLQELGVSEPSAELLSELEAPAAGPVLELFPDVLRTLDQLQQWNVPMCVVSDTWAEGFVEMNEQLGIAQYFEEFVISELMGCNKPDPRMYEAGRRSLNLPAGQCLFVDDDASLVQAAADLGYRAVTLDRGRGSATSSNEVITSLDELVSRVAGPPGAGTRAG